MFAGFSDFRIEASFDMSTLRCRRLKSNGNCPREPFIDMRVRPHGIPSRRRQKQTPPNDAAQPGPLIFCALFQAPEYGLRPLFPLHRYLLSIPYIIGKTWLHKLGEGSANMEGGINRGRLRKSNRNTPLARLPDWANRLLLRFPKLPEASNRSQFPLNAPLIPLRALPARSDYEQPQDRRRGDREDL